jgi:hypothetical protein
MSEYRYRSTGEVKSQGQIRSDHPNTSLPKVWTEATCDGLGIDPILASPQPTPSGDYRVAVRDGVEQDASGNWVYAWAEQDMFSDYTDEEGVTTTKAEHEAAYQADLDAKAAASTRAQRDAKLFETDWTGLSDVTMTAEMAAYRQALRDITDHANFPSLQDTDWPEAP